VSEGTIGPSPSPVLEGPRSPVGPRLLTEIPSFPASGLVTMAPGAATIQDAITANGDNTKFLCEFGAYNLSSRCNPKAGQQFWFENGATITNGAALADAFFDLGTRNNVKVINGTFSGFSNSAINNAASSGWEMAYNDISGVSQTYGANHYNTSWVHHNNFHDLADGPLRGYQSQNAVVEDNVMGPNVGTSNGQKWVQTDGLIVRHNRSHGNVRTGLWFDYQNYNMLVEYNLVENCGSQGMWIEANGATQPGAPVFTNIIRFNHVRNNEESGILLAGSTNTEIYGNRVENNQTVASEGFTSEIRAYINDEHVTSQLSDLADNSIHDNTVVTPSSTKTACTLFADANEALRPPDPNSYINNTKRNYFDYNTYDLTNVAAGDHFLWWRTFYTWAEWRALAVAPDANSTAT
jgi:parallel beta-helix repeat protein